MTCRWQSINMSFKPLNYVVNCSPVDNQVYSLCG
jgi:hypothetical protein